MNLSKLLASGAAAAALVLSSAAPAAACAGLVTPGGNVRLTRTATLAAHHAGVEHYVTSFSFEGGGAEFGSIVPLPAVPTKVERGGDWTLQRLERETQPQPLFAAAEAAGGKAAVDDAVVLQQVRIDALDITILEGGADAVGKWAKEHGFQLTPDAPEVLDFYAKRSKIFMAAAFDAQAAADREQGVGEGTPIHLTMPLENPWVPLRILGLGVTPDQAIDADVYLLTDRKPALLPATGDGFESFYDQAASETLLADLRSDKGMEWVTDSMWLTGLRVGGTAGQIQYDLATDVSGRDSPSFELAGLSRPAPVVSPVPAHETSTGRSLMPLGFALLLLVAMGAAAALRVRTLRAR